MKYIVFSLDYDTFSKVSVGWIHGYFTDPSFASAWCDYIGEVFGIECHMRPARSIEAFKSHPSFRRVSWLLNAIPFNCQNLSSNVD